MTQDWPKRELREVRAVLWNMGSRLGAILKWRAAEADREL